MQRFMLSAFSILLVTAAVAPSAQALPQVSEDFNLQTLRLNEFDARDRLAPTPQAWSPQAEAEYQDYSDSKTTQWDAPEAQEEEAAETVSVTSRRHELLDRS
ncbi:MAG: hypothetical protein AAFV85_06480 [Cyanobacteria bacterium J06634_6]